MKSLAQGKFYLKSYLIRVRSFGIIPTKLGVLNSSRKSRQPHLNLGHCLFALSLLLTGIANADYKVGIVLSGDNPAYEKLAQTITKSLQASTLASIQVSSHTLTKQGVVPLELITKANTLITVGTSATALALESPSEAKIISTFITQNAASKLLVQHKNHDKTGHDRRLGGIYLDQPAQRILRLARLINPSVTQVGMLTGTLSNARTPEFQEQAKAFGLTLNTAQLNPQHNPVKILEPIMSNSQAYIVLPDKADFNRSTARWIIFLSYRHGIPVIGYSNRYIDAGALASIFSTPEQIGQQTAELVIDQLRNPTAILPFEFPKYYVVRFNDKVKRSLGFSQLDETEIRHSLKELEASQENSSGQEGFELNE